MNKPHHASGYKRQKTELAESVLLEAWSRLGEYRDKMVLVGGLVPRYLINQTIARQQGNLHCGTMDIDLGVSIAVTDAETYRSIRSTLDTMGFTPGKNERGREQLHSFIKQIGGVEVNIDFLTTIYGGPDNSLMRELEGDLRAIQVEGLGLALNSPHKIQIEGNLLSGGISTEEVNVCREIPFIILKSLAFDSRRECKDVYDLVYVLVNYEGGAEAVAQLSTKEEILEESFKKAVAVLQNRFRDISHDGPKKYAQFVDTENAEAIAFAAVQEFLSGIPG